MIAGVFVQYFFCSGITRNVLYFCYHGGKQVMGNMCGDWWKDKDDFIIFLIYYTSVFIVSLASKKSARLRVIRPRCHSVPYFPFCQMDSHIEDCTV